jgi:hypothetical protein
MSWATHAPSGGGVRRWSKHDTASTDNETTPTNPRSRFSFATAGAPQQAVKI